MAISPSLDPALQQLLRQIGQMQSRITQLERNQRTAQAPFTSIDAGSLTVSDGNGNTVLTMGLQDDGTYAVSNSSPIAPTTPSTPTVTPIIQGITVTWDGTMSDGTSPTSDFLAVEIYASTTPGFTPSGANLLGALSSAGSYPIHGLLPNVAYYVTMIAVSQAGVQSGQTPYVAATPVTVASGISEAGLTAAQVGYLGVLNANPFFAGGNYTGWTGGIPISGSALTAAAPGAPYTYAYQAPILTNINENNQPFPVTAGQQILVTAWVSNTWGSVNLGLAFFTTSAGGTPGAFASNSVPTNSTGAWQQVATVITVPGGGWTYAAPVASTVSVSYWQALFCLPNVPGGLSAAGTIIAAQIAAGAVIAGVVDGTTITGATLIADGTSGQFLAYTGTPAVGNLVGSFSGVAGNDWQVTNPGGGAGSGNNYPAGFALGLAGFGQIQLDPVANQPFDVTSAITGIASALAQYYTPDGNEVWPSELGAMVLGSGSSAKMTGVSHSPFGGSGSSGAAMLLEAENDGGTDTPVITFGTVMSPDGDTLVFQPVMTLTPYALVLYSGTTTQTVVTKTSGSGTIPIPVGVSTVKAEAWGASGGSSGSGAGTGGGNGGGGGEYAAEASLAVTGGGTVSYSVGAGGIAGSSGGGGGGGAGGISTLTGTSVTVTAHGGHGAGPVGAGAGSGGTGSTNTTSFSGGGGATGSTATHGGGGGGGASGGVAAAGNAGVAGSGTMGGNGGLAVSGGGGGGNGGNGSTTGAGHAGVAGTMPGGAPGGAGSGTGSLAGLAGSAGQVRVTYTNGAPPVGFAVNFGSAFSDQFGNNIPAGITSTLAVNAAQPGGPASTQEGWHSMTLANGWANQGSGNVTAQYRMLAAPASTVEVTGVINGASATSATFFTLPAGYYNTSTQQPFWAGTTDTTAINCFGQCTTSGALQISVNGSTSSGYTHSFTFHGFLTLSN